MPYYVHTIAASLLRFFEDAFLWLLLPWLTVMPVKWLIINGQWTLATWFLRYLLQKAVNIASLMLEQTAVPVIIFGWLQMLFISTAGIRVKSLVLDLVFGSVVTTFCCYWTVLIYWDMHINTDLDWLQKKIIIKRGSAQWVLGGILITYGCLCSSTFICKTCEETLLTTLRAGSLSRSHYADPRQSRESSDHSSVRLLRRVFTQIRVNYGVALLHRDIRLPQPLGHHWRNGWFSVCLLVAVAKNGLASCRISPPHFCPNCHLDVCGILLVTSIKKVEN